MLNSYLQNRAQRRKVFKFKVLESFFDLDRDAEKGNSEEDTFLSLESRILHQKARMDREQAILDKKDTDIAHLIELNREKLKRLRFGEFK